MNANCRIYSKRGYLTIIDFSYKIIQVSYSVIVYAIIKYEKFYSKKKEKPCILFFIMSHYDMSTRIMQ